MKRTSLFGLIMTASLLFSGVASADVRIAVINAGPLVTSSPQFKSAEEAMRKEFESRAKKLESDVKSLGAEFEKFKRDADIMSSAERSQKEKELTTRRIDAAQAERQFKEDFATRRQELFQNVLADITSVIETVAKEGNYDMVLQDPVYAADNIDITETVLKRLQKGK